MTLSLRHALPIAVAGVALATAGCKTTSCHPPACLAEAPGTVIAAPPPPCSQCAPPPACSPPPCSQCAPPAWSTPGAMTSVPATRYVQPASAPVSAARPAADPDAQARIDALRASVDAQNRKNAEMEAKLAQVETSMGRGGARGAAPLSTGPAEESARRLAEELKSVPGTQVLVEGGSAVAVVTDSFAPGSDKLKTSPDLHTALQAISQAMARHPEARVTVTGHTDSTPIKASKWQDNESLSKARAEVVANALATDGVSRDRMRVEGVGPKNPMVSPEKTAGDRARNRRVEVEFAFAK